MCRSILYQQAGEALFYSQFYHTELQIKSCSVSAWWNYFVQYASPDWNTILTFCNSRLLKLFCTISFTRLIYKLNLAACQPDEIILYIIFHQAQIQFYYFVQSVSLGCYNNWIMQRNSLAKLFCTVCFTWLIYKLNLMKPDETYLYWQLSIVSRHLAQIQFQYCVLAAWWNFYLQSVLPGRY